VKATSLPPSLVPLKFQARSLQFCSEMSPGSWPGEHAQWTETFSNSPLGISYEYFGRVEKQANPLTLVSQPPGNVFCSAQSPQEPCPSSTFASCSALTSKLKRTAQSRAGPTASNSTVMDAGR